MTCIISYNNVQYENWNAFVLANESLRIASVPYVVVDQEGVFTITNVVIGTQTDPKAACMNGGWRTYEGKNFKNQGQCVSYVQANKNASFKREQ